MRNPFKRTTDKNGNTIVAPAEEIMAFGMLLGIGLYSGVLKVRFRDEKTKRFRPHLWTDVELANKMADAGGFAKWKEKNR